MQMQVQVLRKMESSLSVKATIKSQLVVISDHLVYN